MTTLNVQSNGIAPSSAKVGDTINTAGGNYTIVEPGTVGATYNSASGRWSIKHEDIIGQIGMANQNTNNTMQNAAKMANSVSADSSAKQYEYNAREAEKTRQWQERMSNTAHQREVQDLIKAGLNPVLSITGGNGSTTPSGATASGSSYQGQKSDTESVSGVLASILGVMLNNQNSRDIAQIQKDAMIQGASISSAASMYGANMNYKGVSENANPLNSFMQYLMMGGQNGKELSGIEKLGNNITSIVKSGWNWAKHNGNVPGRTGVKRD